MIIVDCDYRSWIMLLLQFDWISVGIADRLPFSLFGLFVLFFSSLQRLLLLRHSVLLSFYLEPSFRVECVPDRVLRSI